MHAPLLDLAETVQKRVAAPDLWLSHDDWILSIAEVVSRHAEHVEVVPLGVSLSKSPLKIFDGPFMLLVGNGNHLMMENRRPHFEEDHGVQTAPYGIDFRCETRPDLLKEVTQALIFPDAQLARLSDPGWRVREFPQSLRLRWATVLRTGELALESGWGFDVDVFGRRLAHASLGAQTMKRGLRELRARRPNGKVRGYIEWHAAAVAFGSQGQYDGPASQRAASLIENCVLDRFGRPLGPPYLEGRMQFPPLTGLRSSFRLLDSRTIAALHPDWKLGARFNEWARIPGLNSFHPEFTMFELRIRDGRGFNDIVQAFRFASNLMRAVRDAVKDFRSTLDLLPVDDPLVQATRGALTVDHQEYRDAPGTSAATQANSIAFEGPLFELRRAEMVLAVMRKYKFTREAMNLDKAIQVVYWRLELEVEIEPVSPEVSTHVCVAAAEAFTSVARGTFNRDWQWNTGLLDGIDPPAEPAQSALGPRFEYALAGGGIGKQLV